MANWKHNTIKIFCGDEESFSKIKEQLLKEPKFVEIFKESKETFEENWWEVYFYFPTIPMAFYEKIIRKYKDIEFEISVIDNLNGFYGKLLKKERAKLLDKNAWLYDDEIENGYVYAVNFMYEIEFDKMMNRID